MGAQSRLQVRKGQGRKLEQAQSPQAQGAAGGILRAWGRGNCGTGAQAQGRGSRGRWAWAGERATAGAQQAEAQPREVVAHRNQAGAQPGEGTVQELGRGSAGK